MKPRKLTKEEQVRNLQSKELNKGSLKQSEGSYEKFVNGFAPHEKQVASNPIVQGAVLGVTAAVALPAIAGSVENIANLTVVTIESNPIVAVCAGIVEGTAKGLSGTPPDTPPLVNNPISSTVSDVVNNVFTFIKEKLDE